LTNNHSRNTVELGRETIWAMSNRIAQALGVKVGYFFEGLQTADRFVPSPQQQMLLDLARDYLNIPDPRHREAILSLARALAEAAVEDDTAA
jgi:hypothetical protein